MRTMSGGKCPANYCQNKTALGYCKTTVCINPMYSNIGTAQYGQGAQKVVVTNADRIRAMSDEKLAEFCAYTLPYAPWCDYNKDEGWCELESCKPCAVEWLKSPVEK